MTHTQLACILLLFVLPFRAQQVTLSLKEDEITRVSESTATASLFVVINNEKDPLDAALVNAVKKYWKVGPYKFIAKAEFVDLKLKGDLKPNQFYLYDWFQTEPLIDVNALQLTSVLNSQRTGFFKLSLIAPKETESKNTKTKSKTKAIKPSTIHLDFDLSSSMASTKDKILDGYFDLMVKYFNHEIDFCKNFKDLKDFKRENKNGYVFFGTGLQDLQTKDILLVKEQIQKLSKKDEKAGKKPSASDAVAQFDPPSKNVFTVYPEDIKLALEKKDKKVLLYTNNMLLSAEDGAVVAAPGAGAFKAAKKDYGFLVASWGILILAAAIGYTMR